MPKKSWFAARAAGQDCARTGLPCSRLPKPGGALDPSAREEKPEQGACRERPNRIDFTAIIGTRRQRHIAHGGAHQAPARGPDPAHAAAPGGAERPQPARFRRHDHVRRIFSRPHRNQCARRRLAGVSLGDAGPADDQQRHGRRRLVGGRARARRGAPRPRRRSRLPRISAGARDRRDLLHRAAAGRALHVPVDGRTGRNAVRRARLRERGAGRRRLHLREQSAGQCGARHRQYELPRGRADRLCCWAHRHLARADLWRRTVAGARSGRRGLGTGDSVRRSAAP